MPVTYDETRLWTYWYRLFTPSDLADTMGVPSEAIEGFLIGLQRNGTIEDTGDYLVNGHGPEPILAFVPLPPGPSQHFTKTPEWQVYPCGADAPPNRGMPVRIRSERMMRRILSTSGAAAKHRQREKRYKKMQDDQAKKKAEVRARRIKREQAGISRKVKHKGKQYD